MAEYSKTKLTTEEAIDKGFSVKHYQLDDFINRLEADERYVVYRDARETYFYFYDLEETTMYKCSHKKPNVPMNFKVMKKRYFIRRDFKMKSKGIPEGYNKFLYRCYDTAIAFWKIDEMPVRTRDESMKIIFSKKDNKIAKELREGLSD